MSTDTILAPVASLTLPDSAAMTGRAQQALSFIQSFEIDSQETYSLAADELRAIGRMHREALVKQIAHDRMPPEALYRAVDGQHLQIADRPGQRHLDAPYHISAVLGDKPRGEPRDLAAFGG